MCRTAPPSAGAREWSLGFAHISPLGGNPPAQVLAQLGAEAPPLDGGCVIRNYHPWVSSIADQFGT